MTEHITPIVGSTSAFTVHIPIEVEPGSWLVGWYRLTWTMQDRRRYRRQIRRARRP